MSLHDSAPLPDDLAAAAAPLVTSALTGRGLREFHRATTAALPQLRADSDARHALARRLKDEADRHWRIDARVSLRLARALTLLGVVTGDTAVRALGTMARADAIRQRGDNSFARVLLARAAALFGMSDDQIGWARTQISVMGAQMEVGQLQQALATAESIWPIVEQSGHWLRLARLTSNAASVHWMLGDLHESLAQHDVVLALCAAHPGPEAAALRAQTLKDKSTTLCELGRLGEALAVLEDARVYFAGASETRELAMTDWNIGWVRTIRGRYSAALQALEAARAAHEALRLPAEVARIEHNIVQCYDATNRSDKVLLLAGPLDATLETYGHDLERVTLARYHARALLSFGRFDEAEHILTAAAERMATAGFEVWWARCVLDLARVLLTAGGARLREAADHADAALDVFGRHDMTIEIAEAMVVAARAAEYIEPEAIRRGMTAAALSAARTAGVPDCLAAALALHARLDRDTGDLDAASACALEAVATLEILQRTMTIDGRRHYLSRERQAIYEMAIDIDLRRGAVDAVFDVVERAKSRALLDHLLGEIDLQPRLQDEADRKLAEKLAQAREEHRVYTAALAAGDERTASLRPHLAHTEPERRKRPAKDERHGEAHVEARLLDRLGKVESTIHDLIDLLHRRNPAYDDAEVLRGVGTIDPRPYLAPGHLLISYLAIGEDLLIVVVDHTGIDVQRRRGAWARIVDDVQFLRLNFETTAETFGEDDAGALRHMEEAARVLLRRLWDALLEPFAPRLAAADRLTVVPSGALYFVPFAALLGPSGYLIQQLPVSVVPSASILAVLHRRADRRGVGATSPASTILFGNSMGGGLPYVAEELRGIAASLAAEMVLDEQATREALLERVSHATIVHIAAHGAAHSRDPLFSYIELAGSRLTVADVLQLRLNVALATLSACETGLGDVRAGDDLFGMGWALLYAGCDAVMQSLWRVEDRCTARLMRDFYRALAAGQARDESLQLAQLAVLTHTGSTGFATSHPYFWAAFHVMGDHRPIAAFAAR